MEAGGMVVGSAVKVTGDVRGEQDVTVDGRLEGSVQLDATLTVGPNAVVKADLRVQRAVIHGVVMGTVVASDAVVLAATARVVADLYTPQIIMEDGARFCGNVGDASQAPARMSLSTAPVAGAATPQGLPGLPALPARPPLIRRVPGTSPPVVRPAPSSQPPVAAEPAAPPVPVATPMPAATHSTPVSGPPQAPRRVQAQAPQAAAAALDHSEPAPAAPEVSPPPSSSRPRTAPREVRRKRPVSAPPDAGHGAERNTDAAVAAVARPRSKPPMAPPAPRALPGREANVQVRRR